KTKASPSGTADLGDFMEPKQLSLTLGLADAGQDQSKCPDPNSSTTSFTVTGTATPSPGDSVDSTLWQVVPGSGTANITSPSSLSTTVDVTPPGVTLSFTVQSHNHCTTTDQVVLTVTTCNPVLTCPDNQTGDCQGGNGAFVTYPDPTVSGGTTPYG